VCGRIFCANCTLNAINASRDATEQAARADEWLRVCNYCEWIPGGTSMRVSMLDQTVETAQCTARLRMVANVTVLPLLHSCCIAVQR
jgi:hypothetical protein